MSMIECPHCHIGVYAMADGTCPSCRKNTRDLTGIDPNQISLTVSNNEMLPPVCHQCGLPTSRYVTVTQSFGGDAPSRWGGLGTVVLGLLSGVWIFSNDRGGSRENDEVHVKFPQCDACASQGKPEPIAVNTEELRMTFVVHKDFRQAVEAEAE